MTNDTETLLMYYRYQEQLMKDLSNPEGFSLKSINAALTGLCKLLGISKGVTEFYASIAHEKQHKGEIFTCYDSGEESEEFLCLRFITKSMTVAKCTSYVPKGAPPLSPEDRDRVELFMRCILTFISRNRLETIVERLTFYDDNGYRNLRFFLRRLVELQEKHQLSGNAAIHFNLRHFTLINREIGRNAGDVVMRNYFRYLEDLLGTAGTICRVGGDNFVAILPQPLLNRFLSALAGVPISTENQSGNRIMISACAGVFIIPKDFVFDQPGDIMDRIVAASHAAKSGGGDSIVYYSEQMLSSKEKRMQVEQLFPEALKKEQFKVFYQPKIDVLTGELVGAEALCRWFCDGRIVPPMEFIPVLEQTSDICTLDFYMLDHVCADIKRWLSEGKKVVRISVNLSRKHMMDVDLLEHILKIVDKHQVPHRYIEIELTETTTDVEFRDLKRVVSGLQQSGIFTSVDDFGMGYSSLNLIREIPWNVLKVDRSFLPLDTDGETSTRSIMFKYVVAMAKELGLECIAEGVETNHQVKVLKDNHCSLAQGYYFDRPLPLTDFEERLSGGPYDTATDAD